MGAPTHVLKLTNGSGTDDLKFRWEINGVIGANGRGQLTDNVADETKTYRFRGTIEKFEPLRGAGSASINGTSFQFQDLPGYDTRNGVPREPGPEPKPEPEPEESAVEQATDALGDLIGDWDFDREPPHLLEFRSADGEPVDYRVSVSKELAPTSENGATHDPQDSVEREGGDWTARGAVAGGLDAYRYGGSRRVFESDHPEKLEARVNEKEWQSAAAYGCVQKTSGGGASSGHEPPGSGSQNTDAAAKERAERANLTIDSIERVSATSDIGFADNTLYVVDDELEWDGPVRGNDADNVAVVGTADASMPIPAGRRAYSVIVEGGEGFLWSGVDLDQSAPGAWGRIRAVVSGGAVLADIETIGSGRPANPDPSSRLPGGKAGPAYYLPATDEDGTNRIVNVTDNHRGIYAEEHEGDREIGVWVGPRHEGTLDIEDSRFEAYPNNGTYCTACSGTVNVRDSTVVDCGVAQIRVARGEIDGCTVRFGATDSALGNAHAPEHATQGIAVEDKRNNGGSVDIRDTTVEMGKVGKCGGGVDVRSGAIDTMRNVTVHISDEARWGDQAGCDLIIDGSANLVAGCTFSGDARTGVVVWNRGPPVEVNGTTIDYPSGRRQYRGKIRQ